MGKLVSTLFVSLDGVYQAPGGPEEDPRGGFTQGGWTFPFGDEDFGGFITGLFGRASGFLLGRRTYDIFAGYWPKVTDPANPVAAPLNSLPKYVVSSTLRSADWSGTTVLGGDVGKEVAALKERTDGELQIHGSGALVRTLIELRLLDTLHLLTFPVVLGSGFRLFPEGTTPTRFRHTAGLVSSTGVSLQSYDLAGEPEFGSFGPPEDQ
ncbi:dihydrofolate reductase family protein [Streptomyces sp. J2-1]|uniref:dihydrofolate reductase family protein n=1 Tax=Streptomyces corallincola TaxID=2851888 RepID=UPI001C388F0A|nr:dihydrofolate reductase family protein [Streptomyces corallincola]MBV2355683.1 dihydrofolate reductase family protein [Streptomyces corallincola]